MMNLKETWKNFWINTSSSISGIIVLFTLLFLIGLDCWSYFILHSASSTMYVTASAIGGVLVYKLIKLKKIKLDEERIVEGKLAVCIGCVAGILCAVSMILAVLKLMDL
jgi:hypothetical protein